MTGAIVCRATSEAVRVLTTRRDEINAELDKARDRHAESARRVAYCEACAADVVAALIAVGADPQEPIL